MKNQVTGAILSGGRNRRMKGRNKAFIEIDGNPIIDRTVAIFESIFNEIIIITNEVEEYSNYRDKCVIVNDEIKNIGPLGGIHAALSTAKNNAVFFSACDMPNLHNEIIISQIDYFNKKKGDALLPRIGNLVEPLHAIYKKSIKDDLEQFIKNSPDHSVKSFLKTINVAYWDLENTSFYRNTFKNINTPEDIDYED
ncbi:MAG: molybdenum cofactor guanylyltransferase [Candidatus Omnitrophota bacterium]